MYPATALEDRRPRSERPAVAICGHEMAKKRPVSHGVARRDCILDGAGAGGVDVFCIFRWGFNASGGS